MNFLLYYGIKISEEDLLQSKKGINDLFDRYADESAKKFYNTVKEDVQLSMKISDIFCWLHRLHFHHVEFNQFSLHLPLLHTIKAVPQKELQSVIKNFQNQVDAAKIFASEEEIFLKKRILENINKEFSKSRWIAKFHLIIEDFDEVT